MEAGPPCLAGGTSPIARPRISFFPFLASEKGNADPRVWRSPRGPLRWRSVQLCPRCLPVRLLPDRRRMEGPSAAPEDFGIGLSVTSQVNPKPTGGMGACSDTKLSCGGTGG